jgi:hypothetical protein
MKELIKPNVIESGYEFVDTNCTEQTIVGTCRVLTCVCRATTNDSIGENDDIIF